MLLAVGAVKPKVSVWVAADPVTATCKVSLVKVDPQPPVSLKMKVALLVVVVTDDGESVPLLADTHADVTFKLTDAPGAAPAIVTVNVVCP